MNDRLMPKAVSHHLTGKQQRFHRDREIAKQWLRDNRFSFKGLLGERDDRF